MFLVRVSAQAPAGLTEALFAEVNAHLADRGITLHPGTLVDAAIIATPSPARNKARARDPDLSSMKKDHDGYLGTTHRSTV